MFPLKIINKGEWIYILNNIKSFLKIVIAGIVFITAIIFIKYRPAYVVTLKGVKLGYIGNVNSFQELIEGEIINQEGKNIANVSLTEEPEYKLELVQRGNNLNEAEIIENLKNENTLITYKYYEVALNDETKAYVDTLEEAEQIVNSIKDEFDGDDLELDLSIHEEYVTNYEDINTESLEVASNTVEAAVQEIKEENEALAIINDVKLSVLPVSGTITSRYGVSSRLRKSTHTGLDIACSTGTDIKVVSGGTVTFAEYNGSYGNLVKVDHGNGVETWYGHCSKIYAKVGQTVDAGDVIAAVGSTGNSTGPHLHFEIRINGNTVNPQDYVY